MSGISSSLTFISNFPNNGTTFLLCYTLNQVEYSINALNTTRLFQLGVMAAALSMTFGRSGALLGNLLFGFLIDLNCIVPIILFSTMLFISGFLCWLLPTTGSEALD